MESTIVCCITVIPRLKMSSRLPCAVSPVVQHSAVVRRPDGCCAVIVREYVVVWYHRQLLCCARLPYYPNHARYHITQCITTISCAVDSIRSPAIPTAALLNNGNNVDLLYYCTLYYCITEHRHRTARPTTCSRPCIPDQRSIGSWSPY